MKPTEILGLMERLEEIRYELTGEILSLQAQRRAIGNEIEKLRNQLSMEAGGEFPIKGGEKIME